jgi:hypothetical protein
MENGVFAIRIRVPFLYHGRVVALRYADGRVTVADIINRDSVTKCNNLLDTIVMREARRRNNAK